MSGSPTSRLLGLLGGRVCDPDGGAFRQPQLEEQLGAGRGRKELLLHETEARDRGHEGEHGRDHDGAAPAQREFDGAPQRAIDAGVVDGIRIVARARLGELGQQLQAEIGREHHGDHPRGDQGEPDHPEDAARIFAGARFGEADRQEARRRHQGSGQHRERGRGPCIGGGAGAVEALLHFHHHHLDGDDGVVDQEPERDDQRAERDAVEVDAGRVHHGEHDRQHQRNRQRHHDAGAPAERDEADQQHDAERLHEGLDEFRDRFLDDVRLVRDLGDLDADRKLGGDRLHGALEVFTERDDVGAVLHGDAEAERGLAVLAHHEGGRVLVAALAGRDVAQAEHPAVGLDRHRPDGVDAREAARHPQVDAIGRGVDRAARHHGVLLGDAVEHLLRRDAEGRELGVAELDEDLLRLVADEIDLVDVGDAQQALADILGDHLEVGEGEAVRGEHVDCRIDVAVLVVEIRTGDAGRQVAPDVADLLAHLVPQVLHLGGRRAIDEDDLDERHAGLRVGLDAVEPGQLLQLLLDLVGDLGLHLGRGRARPRDIDDHRLDGEGRVLGAAEIGIGIGARRTQDHDHEQHQGTVRDRPFGEIEARHGGVPSSQVDWRSGPAASFRGPSAAREPGIHDHRPGDAASSGLMDSGFWLSPAPE